MSSKPLDALSPLDGRYFLVTKPLAGVFSESGLISYRIKVEVQYLAALSRAKVLRSFTKKEVEFLEKLQQPKLADVRQVKKIESETRHDVKAVEYYIADKFKTTTLKDCTSYIHLGLTSDDVNNLAYRLMVTAAHNGVIMPELRRVLEKLGELSAKYHDLPMLARTHGQAAIPTTLGKEISVFAIRLLNQIKRLDDYQLTGKLNGAVGGFQALDFIRPRVNWIKFSTDFVDSLGLKPNLHTTQINPADDVVGLFGVYHIINSILIDLDQDFWRYISDDWLVQDVNKSQVGSSTMPQKVNPIQFENSEGNLCLANGLIETLSRKLPVSRLQRDLSDSTVNRNCGLVFGYSLIAYTSLLKGLGSIRPDKVRINKDLNKNYNILSEAMQTSLRYSGDTKAYQKAVEMMKGKNIDKEDWQELTSQFGEKLSGLTPSKYIGLSSKLTQLAVKEIDVYLNKVYKG